MVVTKRKKVFKIDQSLLPLSPPLSYFPGIKHNAGNMLEEPTSLQRLFFDRGNKITPSQAPNGMTNGVDVRFISLEKKSSLQNFTQDVGSIPTLPSKVNVKLHPGQANTNTSRHTATASQQQSSNTSNAASSTHTLSYLLLISLVTLAALVVDL